MFGPERSLFDDFFEDDFFGDAPRGNRRGGGRDRDGEGNNRQLAMNQPGRRTDPFA